MDISRSDGFFVDFTEMLRWVDIFFYSHEYQPTFNIGRWFQFQRSWRCWDKKVWECVKVFLNTLKMCKLQRKPVFTCLSAVFFRAFEMGSLHVRRTCFVSLAKSLMSQPYSLEISDGKKLLVYITYMVIKCLPRDVCPVPNQHNQLGPVKSLFQKGTSNYGSQVPKVGLRRWSISPTDQEKTLKFIAVIRKCSWAKRWANFIYQKWTSLRCFQLFPSIILTLPYFAKMFASDVWFKTPNLTPWDPCQKRVKNVLENPPYFLLVKWAVPVRRPRENGTWGNFWLLLCHCAASSTRHHVHYIMYIYVSCLSNQKCSSILPDFQTLSMLQIRLKPQ